MTKKGGMTRATLSTKVLPTALKMAESAVTAAVPHVPLHPMQYEVAPGVHVHVPRLAGSVVQEYVELHQIPQASSSAMVEQALVMNVPAQKIGPRKMNVHPMKTVLLPLYSWTVRLNEAWATTCSASFSTCASTAPKV